MPSASSRSLKKLVAFYELGLEALEEDKANPRRGTYSPGVCQRLAKARRVRLAMVYHARLFAKCYTKRQFRELCELPGMVLTPTHIIQLLPVKDKRKRAGLQRRAAKEHWSVQRLGEEIRKVQRRRIRGRRRRDAADVQDALVLLEQATFRWLTLWGDVQALLDENKLDSRELPAAVQKKIGAAAKALRRLEELLERQILDKGS